MTPVRRAAIARIREDLKTWASFDSGATKEETSSGREDIATLLEIVDRDYPKDDTCELSRQELIELVKDAWFSDGHICPICQASLITDDHLDTCSLGVILK